MCEFKIIMGEGDIVVQFVQGGFVFLNIEIDIIVGSDVDLCKVSDDILIKVLKLDVVLQVISNFLVLLLYFVVQIDWVKVVVDGFSEQVVGGIVMQVMNLSVMGMIVIDEKIFLIYVDNLVKLIIQVEFEVFLILMLKGSVFLLDIVIVIMVNGFLSVIMIKGLCSVMLMVVLGIDNMGNVLVFVQVVVDLVKVLVLVIVIFGGVIFQQSSLFGQLGFVLLVVILIVYVVMVVIFKSLWQFLLLLVLIFFVVIGVIVLQVVLGVLLGVVLIIGFLMFVGIVVMNVIVLVDFINQYCVCGMKMGDVIIYGVV